MKAFIFCSKQMSGHTDMTRFVIVSADKGRKDVPASARAPFLMDRYESLVLIITTCLMKSVLLSKRYRPLSRCDKLPSRFFPFSTIATCKSNAAWNANVLLARNKRALLHLPNALSCVAVITIISRGSPSSRHLLLSAAAAAKWIIALFFSQQSKLVMEGFRSLKEGEQVEFTYKKSSKGLESLRVTGPGGGPCAGSERRPKGKVPLQKRKPKGDR